VTETFSKPGTADVSPSDRKKLAPLIRHYMGKARPFTACVRDQIKHGLSRDHANRRCAVIKDIGHGGTGWRGKKLSFDDVKPEALEIFSALSDEDLVEMYWNTGVDLAGTGLEATAHEMLLAQADSETPMDGAKYLLALSQERERLGLLDTGSQDCYSLHMASTRGIINFDWDPDEHPRDLIGRFKRILRSAPTGTRVELPDGTGVKVGKRRSKVRDYDIVDQGASVGSRWTNAEDAAKDVFERSAVSDRPESMGGSTPQTLTDVERTGRVGGTASRALAADASEEEIANALDRLGAGEFFKIRDPDSGMPDWSVRKREDGQFELDDHSGRPEVTDKHGAMSTLSPDYANRPPASGREQRPAGASGPAAVEYAAPPTETELRDAIGQLGSDEWIKIEDDAVIYKHGDDNYGLNYRDLETDDEWYDVVLGVGADSLISELWDGNLLSPSAVDEPDWLQEINDRRRDKGLEPINEDQARDEGLAPALPIVRFISTEIAGAEDIEVDGDTGVSFFVGNAKINVLKNKAGKWDITGWDDDTDVSKEMKNFESPEDAVREAVQAGWANEDDWDNEYADDDIPSLEEVGHEFDPTFEDWSTRDVLRFFEDPMASPEERDAAATWLIEGEYDGSLSPPGSPWDRYMRELEEADRGDKAFYRQLPSGGYEITVDGAKVGIARDLAEVHRIAEQNGWKARKAEGDRSNDLRVGDSVASADAPDDVGIVLRTNPDGTVDIAATDPGGGPGGEMVTTQVVTGIDPAELSKTDIRPSQSVISEAKRAADIETDITETFGAVSDLIQKGDGSYQFDSPEGTGYLLPDDRGGWQVRMPESSDEPDKTKIAYGDDPFDALAAAADQDWERDIGEPETPAEVQQAISNHFGEVKDLVQHNDGSFSWTIDDAEFSVDWQEESKEDEIDAHWLVFMAEGNKDYTIYADTAEEGLSRAADGDWDDTGTFLG
jgi:hypothetical protein